MTATTATAPLTEAEAPVVDPMTLLLKIVRQAFAEADEHLAQRAEHEAAEYPDAPRA